MCNFVHTSTPFFYGLLARFDGQANAFLTEEIIELGDVGGSGLVNERMIDVAKGGTSVDASVAIDGQDFRESGVNFVLAL